MHLPWHLQKRHVTGGLRLGALAFAFMLTTALTALAAQANDIGSGGSAPSRANASGPPSYPDVIHVFNGCHLSTLSYLARFKAEFLSEDGQPLVVVMRNADGAKKPHTVALITWQGEWWCRDEYFGVCPLGLKVKPAANLEGIAASAGSVLEKNGEALMRQKDILLPSAVPQKLSSAQLTREVEMAAKLIPVPSVLFWVQTGDEEVPIVFFRPANGQIAAYNPSHGTCLAECAGTDDAGIVKAVAVRLGYHVRNIRSDLIVPGGVVLEGQRKTRNS